MHHTASRTSLTVIAFAAALLSARAAVVVQYSFENNLNDTGAGGTVADNLSYNQGVSGSATPAYGIGVGGGSSATFSGNWFQAPNSTDVNLVDNTWAMEAFIKVSTHNGEWERLIVKWGSTNEYHFGLRNRNLDFFNSSATEVFQSNTAPATSFTDGKWHHIAFSSSAAGSQAWIDGLSVFSGASVTLAAGTDPLGIGDFGIAGSNNALRMHGSVDEILIHDSPIDQTYINSRMALIPEPASLSLLLLATPGLLRRRR